MLLSAIAKKLGRLGASDSRGGDCSRAAVAAILREGMTDAGAELLFIRRTERADDPWSGHIAFPGGRYEDEDVTILATAVRETHEEVGIDLSSANLVARLPDILAYTRGKSASLVVTPFVFALRGEHAGQHTPNLEVAEALWIPFASIARGEGRGTFSWSREGKVFELPCIRFQPGDRVLWGMTYRMVETMLEALGPDDD
ncbi:MAG: CoA pyrophosphatase [Polyangiaceae bacterium]|nr:CoA pyrophosphatase [Polyangiaceae bacterium]